MIVQQEINKYQFVDEFNKIRPDNFSNEGLNALFDWIEEFKQDSFEPYVLDIIELCCDFTEYDSIQQFNEDYGKEFKNFEELEEENLIIKIDDNRFIAQNF